MAYEWTDTLDHQDLSGVMRRILEQTAGEIMGNWGGTRRRSQDPGRLAESVGRSVEQVLKWETGIVVDPVQREVFTIAALLGLLYHTDGSPFSTTWEQAYRNVQKWQAGPTVGSLHTLGVIDRTRLSHPSWSHTYETARQMAPPEA